MKNLYLFICILLMVASCHRSTKQMPQLSELDDAMTEKSEAVDIVPDSMQLTSDSIKLAGVAMSFYNWYLHEKKSKGWTIYASLNKDSTVSLRNIDTHMGILKQLGTLSERFIEHEHRRLCECDRFLAENDWSGADHGSEYAYAEGPCEWFAYDYWFHSQETPHEVELSKLIIQKDTAIAHIDFYYIAGDERYKEYYSVEEYLVLSSEKTWLIDRIIIWHGDEILSEI